MKKIVSMFLFFCVSSILVFSQSDDDLFGDDNLFGDDGIEIVEEVTAKDSLSQGTLFENGSIKIGGTFNTSLSTLTTLFSDDGNTFTDNLSDTTLTPTLSAFLTLDARPTQTLRMYTKFGMKYPFTDAAAGVLDPSKLSLPSSMDPSIFGDSDPVLLNISNWFYLKELFTDFSIADRAFFRFGLHTVTWGTGYFFSPVSDMINTSSINPEDTEAQVDGALNLRAQIVFPDTQNCLWLYVIPSDEFNLGGTDTYLKKTAFAAKGDIVFGSWEFGLGGYWKYQDAPKVMMTASGSLKKINMFGEFVYNYGSGSEWAANSDWDNKTSIIQATVGCSYYWKDPMITFAAQYYYDGTNYKLKNLTDAEFVKDYFYKGHNFAVLANFGRLFGSTDFTAMAFGMVNFGRGDLLDKSAPAELQKAVENVDQYFSAAIISAMLYYSPVKDLKFGIGPYITVSDWNSSPVVSLKLSANLGGGSF